MSPRKAFSAGVVVLALAAALVAAPAQARVKGFSLGVAAGEVAPKSAKIWAHADGTGRVSATVARDRRMRNVVARAQLKAKRSNDGTVQKTIRGLKPGTVYWYRLCRGARTCSDKGRFETAPRPGRSSRIRFAVTGDADPTPLPGESTPFYGTYEAFRAMRRERNDFNVFMGDTIYSDTGVAGPPALTAEQKWAKYAEGLGLRNQRKLRASGGLYSHWDDHEFINDFSVPENGEQLYRAGVRAFTDYAPVEYSSKDGLYRTHRWGKNVELFFLDERSFRSAKASAGGTCDNPDTNSPDLAATAPVAKRNLFSLLIPSLAEPVSQACKNAINDPQRTLLGGRQLRRFLKDVESSKARWKLIMNETPIQQFYGLPYDRWEGYAYERVKLLQELQQREVRKRRSRAHLRRRRRPRERRPDREQHPLPRLRHRAGRDRAVLARDRRRDRWRRRRRAALAGLLQARPAGRRRDVLLAGRPEQLRAGHGGEQEAEDRLQDRDRRDRHRRRRHALRTVRADALEPGLSPRRARSSSRSPGA
jgi:phosphodiesterase/alkaline phosphatase D-like protein